MSSSGDRPRSGRQGHGVCRSSCSRCGRRHHQSRCRRPRRVCVHCLLQGPRCEYDWASFVLKVRRPPIGTARALSTGILATTRYLSNSMHAGMMCIGLAGNQKCRCIWRALVKRRVSACMYLIYIFIPNLIHNHIYNLISNVIDHRKYFNLQSHRSSYIPFYTRSDR